LEHNLVAIYAGIAHNAKVVVVSLRICGRTEGMVEAQQMSGFVLEKLKPRPWILRIGPDFVQDYIATNADSAAIPGRRMDECDHPVELVESYAVCHCLLPN
jgi:hypothetical protein